MTSVLGPDLFSSDQNNFPIKTFSDDIFIKIVRRLMSLNQKITIKLVRGEEIRLMHVVPNTWTELQEALKTMYGSSDFHITYIDEESDNITIANDLDLSEALLFASTKPSLKLHLKPSTLIEDFEELKLEDPPTKTPDPVEAQVPWRSENAPFGRRGRGRGRGRGQFPCFGMMKEFGLGKMMKKKMKSFMKIHKNKLLKMKVLHKNFPRHWVVACGSNIVITWTVMNKGRIPWPEKSVLIDLEGDLKIAEPVVLGEVKPGEVVNISASVTVPMQQGKYSGKWALMVGDDCAGSLKAKVLSSAESIDTKVLTIVSMGFSKEVAAAALEENQGDLNLAVSKILKNFSG